MPPALPGSSSCGHEHHSHCAMVLPLAWQVQGAQGFRIRRRGLSLLRGTGRDWGAREGSTRWVPMASRVVRLAKPGLPRQQGHPPQACLRKHGVIKRTGRGRPHGVNRRVQASAMAAAGAAAAAVFTQAHGLLRTLPSRNPGAGDPALPWAAQRGLGGGGLQGWQTGCAPRGCLPAPALPVPGQQLELFPGLAKPTLVHAGAHLRVSTLARRCVPQAWDQRQPSRRGSQLQPG